MKNQEIISQHTSLIGIELEKPFPLGFGTLSHLPRVFLELEALDHRGQLIKGIGEASIDFPFSHYDAYDILFALQMINLVGLSLGDRQDILNDPEIRGKILALAPAAFAALNMALDDLVGKDQGVSVMDLYGRSRTSGRALASISYQENPARLIAEMEAKIKAGFIPKPKVGQSVEADIETIFAVEQFAIQSNTQYVLDFNAKYTKYEIAVIFGELAKRGCLVRQAIFIEQPTQEAGGISALVEVSHLLEQLTGHSIKVLADESFVTLDDAVEAAAGGLALNFKIHKVGGIHYAREIETELEKQGLSAQGSMVGGTFPTAIGRVYDQQAAAVLRTTSSPSDGWQPSTDWFTGAKHLIQESFERTSDGENIPIDGDGLGVTPDHDKLNKLQVVDPREEYKKIRNGEPGDKIAIILNPGEEYALAYKKLTGRDPEWNLNE